MNTMIEYILKRFPVHLLFIFTSVNIFSVQKFLTGQYDISGLPISIIFLLFLFHLRLLDEIKDFEFDTKHHKDRPVQKGSVSLVSIKKLIVINIILMFSLTYFTNLLLLLAIPIAYTFLMFKEFFIKDFYERSPLVYLLSHQIVFVFLLMFFFSAITGQVYQLQPDTILIYLFYFLPLAIIEIGRKMDYRYDFEGNKTIDSYAYVWGEKIAIVVFFAITLINSYVGFTLTGHQLFAIISIVSVVMILSTPNEKIRKFVMQNNVFITTIYALIIPAVIFLT